MLSRCLWIDGQHPRIERDRGPGSGDLLGWRIQRDSPDGGPSEIFCQVFVTASGLSNDLSAHGARQARAAGSKTPDPEFPVVAISGINVVKLGSEQHFIDIPMEFGFVLPDAIQLMLVYNVGMLHVTHGT